MALRPAGRVTRSQIAGQFLPQRTPGLHEQREVDRLVRHAHLRLVGELLHQPTRDLLRRPTHLELRLDDRSEPTTHRELGWLRSPSSTYRVPLRSTGSIAAHAAVTRDFPRD